MTTLPTHYSPDELLKALGFEQMSDEEKAEVLPPLFERLSKVAFEATLEALDDDGRKRLVGALEDPATAEEKIAEIASEIPGLKERIDLAVQEEILTLRAAKEAL